MNTTDYTGRSAQALGTLFDGLIADVREQWAQAAQPARSPAIPEPMLGAMGALEEGKQ